MPASQYSQGFGSALNRGRGAFLGLGLWLALAWLLPWSAWDVPTSALGGITLLLYLLAAERLDVAARALQQASLTDPLTGLANRRALERGMEQALGRGTRRSSPLAVVTFDVDFFKTINDQCGHAVGDRALRMVGTCLRDVCRAGDLAARLGGDEFVILAPRTSAVEAAIMARRVQDGLLQQHSKMRIPVRLSVSAGIASTEMRLCVDGPSLLAVADRALYGAKETGRNRLAIGAPKMNAALPAPPLAH